MSVSNQDYHCFWQLACCSIFVLSVVKNNDLWVIPWQEPGWVIVNLYIRVYIQSMKDSGLRV